MNVPVYWTTACSRCEIFTVPDMQTGRGALCFTLRHHGYFLAMTIFELVFRGLLYFVIHKPQNFLNDGELIGGTNMVAIPF